MNTATSIACIAFAGVSVVLWARQHVADDLWHEFILYTKNYEQFCRKAFGRFLHHTPAAVLSKGQQGNAGIRRTWFYACGGSDGGADGGGDGGGD
jgi:hypothetical protein